MVSPARWALVILVAIVSGVAGRYFGSAVVRAGAEGADARARVGRGRRPATEEDARAAGRPGVEDPHLMFAIGNKVWPGISKLVEECGEVLQVCGKLIAMGGQAGHFDGSDLRERLTEEIADLQAAVDFVIAHNGLDEAAINRRVAEKRKRFEDWHAEAV
jgi:NTP pyrophosphatase (non-canonical NTP hydrolase)